MPLPDSLHVRSTRLAYDTVAADYEDLVRDELATKPLDRAMLGAFAEVVRAAGAGPVADVGCGPGRIAAYLAGLGVDVFGVDLSPEMIAVARRTHPDLRFEVGNMTALGSADGALGGIVAWYSTVHTPPEALPDVLAEFRRVLSPGGRLLIAFKAGDERRHLDHAYGHELSLDVYWMPPERIAAVVAGAGLEVEATLVREPDERERPRQGRQAFLMARRT
ncbi:class I SAM-dependent DNA methyltransferase [Streptomyces wuyuanensis]|uniref:Methyltransferase domain-containing protein n=1 Tax=Streptomyces wuyuanensis TaxID=1196353 RepID=A0A1H0BVI6_9ACTN|nr:class I SAM-dependent methyltransferase [Streptomyces wuyuanensis]SDN49672.1 Methyltransferase domain-containing protein [Streptomyces wuyuanensis]